MFLPSRFCYAVFLTQPFEKHFPPEDARGFYSKLRTEAAVGETTALVPTINASKAQATVESDRVRIFKEIADAIGMEKFNARLQEYLERAMRAAAAEALLERGGVESVLAGGSKATLGLLRGELEQTKQELVNAQEETKQELALLTTAQEEASKEAKLIGGRIATLEVKMDAMLKLLRDTRGSGAGSQ